MRSCNGMIVKESVSWSGLFFWPFQELDQKRPTS